MSLLRESSDLDVFYALYLESTASIIDNDGYQYGIYNNECYLSKYSEAKSLFDKMKHHYHEDDLKIIQIVVCTSHSFNFCD